MYGTLTLSPFMKLSSPGALAVYVKRALTVTVEDVISVPDMCWSILNKRVKNNYAEDT